MLAYGLDLWFTREASSKTFDVLSEDFSKKGYLKLFSEAINSQIDEENDYENLYETFNPN